MGHGDRPRVYQTAFVIAELNLGQLGDVQTDAQILPVDPTFRITNLLILLGTNLVMALVGGNNILSGAPILPGA